MLGFLTLGGGEIFLLLAILLVIPLAVLSFVFWIWMLIDCVKNDRIRDDEKIVWVLVIALTHFLGAIIYFVAGRGTRRSTA